MEIGYWDLFGNYFLFIGYLMMKPQRIEISYKTIVFITAFFLSLFLLWNVRNIIFLIFVCFMFMEAINPAVSRLEKFHLPRAVAILLIYLAILSFLSFSFALIIPILVEQTSSLVDVLPRTLSNISFFGFNTSNIDWNSQLKILENLPTEIAKAAVSFFSNIFSGFIILVITFYMLLERQHLSQYGFHFFGKKGKAVVVEVLEKLEFRLSSWLNAQLLLMTIIGLFAYIGYSLIGLSYAVPLAIMAGILEAVPNIGPTISTLMAAIIGLTISPMTSALAVGVGLIIQQLENNVIVPRLMKQAVGINPLITILLIATGVKLAGIGGAVLALPVYLTIEVVVNILTNNHKKDQRSR